MGDLTGAGRDVADGIETKTAVEGELDAVVDTAAAAYADEAVSTWVVPDLEVRRRHIRELLAPQLRRALAATDVVVAVSPEGSIVAVSVWHGEGDARAGVEAPAESDASIDDMLGRASGDRLRAVTTATAARHPESAHTYLSAMGTLPHWRGRGVGAAMLRHGLDRAQAAGLPVYLEASTANNERLYLRHGFRRLGPPIPLPDGGPQLQPMWRDPSDRGVLRRSTDGDGISAWIHR